MASAGCKKLSSDTSLLVLNVTPYFGNDPIVSNRSYRTASGDSVNFSRTSFYISNIQLTATDGTTYSDSGYILITPYNFQSVIAGSIPVGNYKSISFNVGVAPSLNHLDPSIYSGGALANQGPTMHFTSNTDGYIFMAVEGMADSTNSNGRPNKAFSYHIGTDSLLRTVNLPDHSVAPYNAVFTAAGAQLMTINIVADFSRLLGSVNIPANPVSNTTDHVLIADTLASHIPLMFRYQ